MSSEKGIDPRNRFTNGDICDGQRMSLVYCRGENSGELILLRDKQAKVCGNVWKMGNQTKMRWKWQEAIRKPKSRLL